MTTRAEKYQRMLDDAFERYWQEVEVIAELARTEVLAPFCYKMGYGFLAGNGTWYLGPVDDRGKYIAGGPSGEDILARTERGRRVLTTLQLSIPEYNYDLGSIMNDVLPSKNRD